MSDLVLIEAVKAGEHGNARALIENGADLNQRDEAGWAPLNFAAGKGDLAMVRLLVEKGADPFQTGRDNRTPYMVALAAGRVEVVKYLSEVEGQTDPERARSLRPERKYSKAYHLRDLRSYPSWSEVRLNSKERQNGSDRPAAHATNELSDDDVVFIHQDFTVTESIWHNENVIFNEINDSWREFCSSRLGYRVPTDLDLIVSNTEESRP